MRPSTLAVLTVILSLAAATEPTGAQSESEATGAADVPTAAIGSPAASAPGPAWPDVAGEEPAGTAEPDARDGSPNLLRDATLLTVATAGYALARNKHRGAILGHGSLSNVLENFRHPIRRALESRDNDSFLTNYVAHPLTWGGIALALKHQGYSDLEALALTQAHSVYWEYVIEGSYVLPSGRDMVTNFVSSTAAVYVVPLVADALFPPSPPRPGDATPPRGPSLSLEPGVVAGPDGPGLGLTLRIR